MFDLNKLLVHKKSFIENCCTNLVSYEPRGILNIEAFYWWALVGHYKPDIILESGVFMGRSTEILARAQQFFNIPHHYAFDVDVTHETYVRDKLKLYKTHYAIQDSFVGFQDIISNNTDKKYVAIIDGPKGKTPLTNLIRLLSGGNCCAIASHDCMPGSKIPDVFIHACQELLPDSDVVITSPEDNSDIQELNDFIMKGITQYHMNIFGRHFQNKINPLLNRSNYVGLCCMKDELC